MRTALLALLALAACDGRAPRPVSADGVRHRDAAPAPAGSVPRGAAAGRAALAAPPPPAPSGARGYRDFCAPCHGPAGAGDGPVIARGFTALRPFAALDPAERAPARTVAIVTRGYRRMLPQAEQIAPAERWAIAAHVARLAERGGRDGR